MTCFPGDPQVYQRTAGASAQKNVVDFARISELGSNRWNSGESHCNSLCPNQRMRRDPPDRVAQCRPGKQ